MKDWAMVMAMEMTLAREKSGCVCAGHRGSCWPTGEDALSWLREEKVGLLVTRVSEEWAASLEEPDGAGCPRELGGPGEPGEPG